MSDPIPGRSPEASALVAEADHLVGMSPKRAVAVAERAIALAREQDDPVTESTAHRVSARAAWALSDPASAMRTARTAVELASGAGSDAAIVEARMLVAYLQHESGDTRAALAELDRAATIATGAEAGRVWHQRGLILQRAGRAQEALACYRRAAPILRRTGQTDRLARLYNNRGVLHSLQGSLHSAGTDLEQARQLYRELGQELMAADATWNLGFVAGRRGDIPAALARYAEAEQIHEAHGTPNAELLLDRCELLLSAGLTDEARATAERAVELLQVAGMAAYRADALLMLAQALLADGAAEQARDTAAEAARLLTRQRRPRMAVIARFVQLRAEERLGPRRQLRARALRLAGQLQAAQWRAHALDARILAARAVLESDPETARRELQEASAARRTGPIELRIRAWYAAALARLAEGDATGAGRAVRAGLDVVARERALLGATELRVRMAGHGADLAGLGVQLALAGGGPRQVLAWSERWRAGALHLRPVRPPDDEAVATALAELRQISAELESMQRDSPEVASLASRRSSLEERVRRLTRQATGAGRTDTTAASSPPRVPELTAALQGRSLIELVIGDGFIHAVTLSAGRARLHRLGTAEQFERLVAAAQFALRRLAVRHGPAGSARQALEQAGTRLGKLLAPALAAVPADTELVLVPTAAVQALPCGIVPALQERPVTVAPSAAAWLRAARRTGADPDGPVLLVAGPGLPGADTEIRRLAGTYPRATVLRGERATAAATIGGVDGARIAHLATHGRLRRDNPLFSALQLADGPLTVYDLEHVAAAPPLVVLSACQSGVSSSLAGEEILGLTAALLSLGTRTVIATVIPVDDQATRSLMTGMHERLQAGLAPATALAAAAGAIREQGDPVATATADGFLCFGAG